MADCKCLMALRNSLASWRLPEKRELVLQASVVVCKSHFEINDSAIWMFSSIRDSEKVVCRGEGGGVILEGEGDLKNMAVFSFPFFAYYRKKKWLLREKTELFVALDNSLLGLNCESE